VTLPVNNLHLVPDSLSDEEACFAEPLAAACRIVEQQVYWQDCHCLFDVIFQLMFMTLF